ncbi:glutathione S-transferase family protein [Oceanicaulis sp. LC35]|uniref:glutathione S-transferase family protein n=1 Tax=Oceanicaulis sp. LC35 TaxID=3349635 RepID=UPI003F82D2E7
MPASDITLYTAATMNGWKPLVFLEEAAIPYTLAAVDFGARSHKTPEFLALNPNGKIPVLVDHSNDDFAVFESGAMLWYLAEKYGRFLSEDAKLRSETLQWLMLQMGGVGPMMGQTMFFRRFAPDAGQASDSALTRFTSESRRLFEVLNTRLMGRDWLAGDAYSIADMAMFPWVRCHSWAGVSIDGLDALADWIVRIDARPAVQRALQLPAPAPRFLAEYELEAC